MIYKKQKFSIFDTDFYQIAMVYAFIMDNKANTTSGYEGFARNVKAVVNPNQNFYIFQGEVEIKNYIKKIKEELNNPLIKEAFMSLIKPKIKYNGWEEEFSKKFDELDTDFDFSVVKNNSKVFPFIPVFQFRGPKWIGQMIETSITNIYNGKTGLATVRYMKDKGIYITNTDLMYLESIVYDIAGTYFERYMEDIDTRAREYKRADFDGFLIEAAFRRAPSKGTADIASRKALENNWKGTSNVSIITEQNQDRINGTMAHAFVMSYKTELESFQVWNKYFPNSTILIDTYDTINATKMLIENNIKPNDVRIDSGDFFVIVPEVRAILDAAGWTDVGIFISGDITPEILTKLQIKGIPYNKSMAGTYYVYCNELVKKVNSGFVYKIVEYVDEETGNIVYPEKKAEGKKNYTGIKSINYNSDGTVIVSKNIGEPLDISITEQFSENENFSF